MVYTNLAKICLEKRIGIDLFIFNPEFSDLATITSLTALTGGQLYYYPTYDPAFDGEKIHY